MQYLEKIYLSGILTNQGSLVMELQEKLHQFLGLSTETFHCLANGTLALQLALSALDINDGEVITTPFSYVATVSSILWQRCTPVFVDIEADNFTIDASKIEAALTPLTKAIMAVHVFGHACNVDEIQRIAAKYNLKVIYDGAHAFASKLNGKSLLAYGDISTLSFHATKLFHTVEGGACIVKDKTISDKLELQKRFGHDGDDHIMLGINAKTSEFHAAMGLANLPHVPDIIAARKKVIEQYDSLLGQKIMRPKQQPGLEYNYAYYPVVFQSEKDLLRIFKALNNADIYPRRYFYPSLNKLPYLTGAACPVSEDIAGRIACLPLSSYLEEDDVERVCKIVLEHYRNRSC
ncbi:aminotransferase DegT [Spirochaetia bacterium]|nr:aminotransferase DegT [Spirochaetia bacterium]